MGIVRKKRERMRKNEEMDWRGRERENKKQRQRTYRGIVYYRDSVEEQKRLKMIK